MRVPISGICLGFRIIKGGKTDGDFGKLYIAQAADKDHDADLITVYVQSVEWIDYMLSHYSHGQLRWIDVYAAQVPDGRERIWVLEKVFQLAEHTIQIVDSA